jgi:hypothetical protein
MSLADIPFGKRHRKISNGPAVAMPDLPRIPQFLAEGPNTMEEAVAETARLSAQGRQSAIVTTDDAGPVAVDLTDPPITAKRAASLIEHQMKDHAKDLRDTRDKAVTAFNSLADEFQRMCEEGARAVQLAADQAKILVEHCENSEADMATASKRMMERQTNLLHGVRNTMVAVLVARDNLTHGGALLNDDQLAAQALAQSITNLEKIAPNATILKKLRTLIDAPAEETQGDS